MDLRISSEKTNFKCRANAVIINNNKVLLLQMNKNGFYCCPGGHIELGEDSKTAVVREVKEESQIDINAGQILAVVENFFKKDKNFHEISFYYLSNFVSIQNEKLKDFYLIENDNGKLMEMDFRWFDLDHLENIKINPTLLKEKLMKRDFSFEHMIFKQKN